MKRRLRISPELWIEALKRETPFRIRIKKNALPADAKCVGMEVEPILGARGYIVLWIESATFRDDDPIDLNPTITEVRDS